VKPRRQVVSPISLRDVYAHPGSYSAKMVIDPRESPTIEAVDVDMRNSDGRQMEYTVRRWGTKLTVQFTIDESTPDGISVIDITLCGKNGSKVRERLTFWCVK
jgi:hypothetical protein